MVLLARLSVVVAMAAMVSLASGADPKAALDDAKPAVDAKPAPATLTKTQKELFAWFAKLGYPVVEKLLFVRARWFDKSGVQAKDGKTTWQVREYVTHGFLAGENVHVRPQTFTILTADAVFHHFKPTRLGTPEAERIFHQPADLRAYAKTILDDARVGGEKFSSRFSKSLQDSGTHGETAYIAVLAWWCHRCGHNDLAAQLMEETRSDRPGTEDDDVRVMASVREEFAEHHYKKILRLMAEKDSTRPEMVQAIEKLIELMPDDPRDSYRPVDEARQMLPVLRRMAEEDRRYPEIADEIERDEIKMLVYDLRDQPGQSFSNPGRCDIFGNYGNWSPSASNAFSDRHNPAILLVEYDIKAIPALIEAITDDRFSRAIEDTKGPGLILRVGDCAVQIIEQIAGRQFRESEHNYLDEELATKVKAKVQAWWKQVQEKGEPVVLGEAVAAGDDDILTSGERLVQRYPVEAAAFLARGIAAAKDDSTREELITLAWDAAFDDSLRAELFKQMKESKNDTVQARAAWGLFLQGGEDERKVVDAYKQARPVFDVKMQGWAACRIALILSLGDRVAAAEALEKIMASASDYKRGEVLRILDPSYVPQLIVDRIDMKPFARRPRNAEQQRVMERLIAVQLKNKTEISVYLRSGKPTSGELAVAALASRWPKVCAFDFAAPPKERERQRLECVKTWEARRGDDRQ